MKHLCFCLFAAFAATALFGLPASASGEGHGPTVHPPINWTDFDYKKKDAFGGEYEKGEEPMAPPFVMALVNFAVFALLLVKFVVPGLRSHFANKHRSIKMALEESAELRKQAADKLDEYQKRIKDVDAEVDEMISQLRSDAEEEKRRLIADAEAQAERTKRDADARIEAEITAARRRLEREVVLAATEAAHKLLRGQASGTDQDTLVDQFLADLPSVASERRPS